MYKVRLDESIDDSKLQVFTENVYCRCLLSHCATSIDGSMTDLAEAGHQVLALFSQTHDSPYLHPYSYLSCCHKLLIGEVYKARLCIYIKCNACSILRI